MQNQNWQHKRAPHAQKLTTQQERIHAMGDKGGKKDKNKVQKQKIKKHDQEAKKQKDKQQPKNP